MDVLRQIITYVLLAVSLLLIVVVLMQKSKEGGLGSAFGGDSGTGSSLSMKGKAASKEAKLQRITKILAIIMGVLALVMVALPRA